MAGSHESGMPPEPQMGSGLLSGRVAVVTGAASGIGRAVLRSLVREEARVAAADIDAERGAQAVREVTAGLELPLERAPIFVRADVSSPDDQEEVVRKALDRFGALHLACNCAGVPGPQGGVADTSIDEWRATIEVNLFGVFYGMRAQIPQILHSGGGAIVNVSSIYAHVGAPVAAAYVTAKHGIVGLTRAAALSHAREGLRVVAVAPGAIETPMLDGLPRDARALLRRMHPMGRLGTPPEVAELVTWLLSERASFVTGACFAVDGGFLAQ